MRAKPVQGSVPYSSGSHEANSKDALKMYPRGMLVSARLLLSYTFANVPDASFTDSIWHDPDFTKPENTFSAKPGIIIKSEIGVDGRVRVSLAGITRLPPSSSSILTTSAKDPFLASLEFYIFPRVIPLAAIPNSCPSMCALRSLQVGMLSKNVSNHTGLPSCIFTDTSRHRRRADYHSQAHR